MTLGSAVLPMLGLLDIGLELMKCLAVAGGGAVGAVGSGLLLRLIVRLALHRPVSRPVLRFTQALGAVVLGMAVWYWVYGPGGSGFGGSGWGLGTGGSGTETAKSADEGKQKTETAAVKKEEPATSAVQDTLRIEMLGGGRVKAGRFYLCEGDRQPKTLSELQQTIRARGQDKDQPVLKRLEIVIYEDSVAKDHPAVRDLEKWAEPNGLAMTLTFPKGKQGPAVP
jgi:hypothetical protein